MYKNNLKYLQKNNPQLAKKISLISLETASKTISAAKNKNGEFVLLKNQKPVDDAQNPVNSIENLYKETIKKDLIKYDFLVLFGLGIGHILDFAYDKTFAQIILFESDLNIIRFVMEYVDLSKYLKDIRIYITDNFNDCTQYIQKKYLLNDRIEFLYLKNYVLEKSSEFTLLTERIYITCQNKIIDMNSIKVQSKDWINNIIGSLKYENKIPLNVLKEKFSGKTALILGAGPSLKSNLETIKEYRDNFIIFAAGRSLETLRINEIIPDFAIFTDSKDINLATTKDLDYLNKLNFIVDIKTDNFVYQVDAKRVFTYYSENNNFSKLLKQKAGKLIELYQTSISGVFCAYNSAKILGCKNFIFAGIDLAFKNDTAYCDDTIAVTNTQNSVKIQNIARKITTIKSFDGKILQTRCDYASFISQLEELIKKDATQIYNVTDFGAYIKGMSYKPLSEVIELIDKNIQNTDEILENLNYPIAQLEKAETTVILDEKNKLNNLIPLIDEWFEMYINHSLFFKKGTEIIVKISTNSMLSDYLQIELLNFTKLIFESNIEKRKEFLINFFKLIKNYSKILDR